MSRDTEEAFARGVCAARRRYARAWAEGTGRDVVVVAFSDTFLREHVRRLEAVVEAGRWLEGLPHECPDTDVARAESSHDGSGAPEYPPEWDLRCDVCAFFRALTALEGS